MTQQEKDEQRSKALVKANAVRTGRKELKDQLAVGKADARELLADPPPLIEEVAVKDFLMWVPGIGKVKARKIVSSAGIYAGTVPLARLSPKTKTRIAELLP